MPLPNPREFRDALLKIKSEGLSWGELFWCIANDYAPPIPESASSDVDFQQNLNFVRSSQLIPVLQKWDFHFTDATDECSKKLDVQTWQIVELVDNIREILDIREKDLEVANSFTSSLIKELRNKTKADSSNEVSPEDSTSLRPPIPPNKSKPFTTQTVDPSGLDTAKSTRHSNSLSSRDGNKKNHMPIEEFGNPHRENLINERSSPSAKMLVIIVGFGAILVGVSYYSLGQRNNNSSQAMQGRSSSDIWEPCKADEFQSTVQARSGETWWPVVGPPASLDIVLSQCRGDAFINKSGNVQVASFSDRDKARSFAERITGVSTHTFQFWVGEPTFR